MMKSADPEATPRAERHQNLWLDFLELQKEFVMKKKRHEALKNKRDTLVTEVRFLRRKHGQLLQMPSANKELCDIHRVHNSNARLPEPEVNNQVRTSDELVGKTYLKTEIHPILASVIQESRSLQIFQDSLMVAPSKKSKTCSIN